jgi:hypothetical protein
MSKRFTFVSFVLGVVVAFLLGLMMAGELTPAPSVVSTEPRMPARPVELARPAAPGGALVNFADVAERVNASVVNIDATSRAASPNPALHAPRRRADRRAAAAPRTVRFPAPGAPAAGSSSTPTGTS